METVLFEKQGRIATITLNRPERLNAANLQLIRDLVEAKRQFEADPELWVAILTGAGRAFCSGADLRRDPNDPDAGDSPATLMERLELGMAWSYKPMIAAVNGPCYGRGFYFALDCDIRIASEQAVFCFAEPRWNSRSGGCPSWPPPFPPPRPCGCSPPPSRCRPSEPSSLAWWPTWRPTSG
ncbi:MAG: enoyl-CoA hydratase/isomerase family protein [Chloroflexi bacterium]|nr:enoyl-CoA hydratase/isomerase family protein [Chloroflexota bacterium]